jgi:hypothetical protein
VRLAALGQRDMDSGAEQISDPSELAQVRRQARKVHFQTFVTALVLTAVFAFLP